MTDVVLVVSRVFPVLILIAIGSLFRKFNFIASETVEDLKRLVVNITLPVLLFITFVDTKFEFKYFGIFAVVFILCCIMLLAGKLLQKFLKTENAYYPSLFAGFETGMMGYSLFSAVYGTDNLFKLAVVDLGQVVFVFFILTAFLKRANGGIVNKRDMAVSFIKSPVIIAIIAGIVCGGTGLYGFAGKFAAFSAIHETLKILSQLTMPVICLVIGYELRIESRNIFLPVKTAFLRILILLIFAFLINTVIIRGMLQLDRMFEIALYTMFILPPPFIIPIFAKGREEGRQLLLNTISVNILMSLAVYLLIVSVISI